MQTGGVSLVGQRFTLGICNANRDKKPRCKKSKEERRELVESFITNYRSSNNGKFPSLNLTHKEVGGSFYIVREIVRDIIQDNRILAPGDVNSLALSFDHCQDVQEASSTNEANDSSVNVPLVDQDDRLSLPMIQEKSYSVFDDSSSKQLLNSSGISGSGFFINSGQHQSNAVDATNEARCPVSPKSLVGVQLLTEDRAETSDQASCLQLHDPNLTNKVEMDDCVLAGSTTDAVDDADLSSNQLAILPIKGALAFPDDANCSEIGETSKSDLITQCSDAKTANAPDETLAFSDSQHSLSNVAIGSNISMEMIERSQTYGAYAFQDDRAGTEAAISSYSDSMVCELALSGNKAAAKTISSLGDIDHSQVDETAAIPLSIVNPELKENSSESSTSITTRDIHSPEEDDSSVTHKALTEEATSSNDLTMVKHNLPDEVGSAAISSSFGREENIILEAQCRPKAVSLSSCHLSENNSEVHSSAQVVEKLSASRGRQVTVKSNEATKVPHNSNFGLNEAKKLLAELQLEEIRDISRQASDTHAQTIPNSFNKESSKIAGVNLNGTTDIEGEKVDKSADKSGRIGSQAADEKGDTTIPLLALLTSFVRAVIKFWTE